MAADNVVRLPRAQKRNLIKEYVSGGPYSLYQSMRVTSPYALDDVTAEFGAQIYEKMLLDSQVSACITVFKASIIEEGATVSPCIADPTDPDYDIAKLIAEKANEMFDDMETSLDDVLWAMLDSLSFGVKLAEQVYYLTDDGMLNLKRLKVKPRTAVGFVVDEHLNVIGIVGDTTGTGIVSGTMVTGDQVLPRNKFAVLTFRPKDADPRGSSILRPAYQPWWRKQQILPEYLKYLAQFAGPSLLGFTPENVEFEPDPDATDGPASATEAMLATLLAFRNGSAAAFPGGAKVDVIGSEGDGKAFLNAISLSNLEVTKALLTQQLATEEGEFMARAAAQVHQDVLDTLIRQGKRAVVRMLTYDILRPWVSYNWGSDYIKYTPHVTLGTIEHQDLAPLMTAIAALMKAGYFSKDQLSAIDTFLGFPVRLGPAMATIAPPASPTANPPKTPPVKSDPNSDPAPADKSKAYPDNTKDTSK